MIFGTFAYMLPTLPRDRRGCAVWKIFVSIGRLRRSENVCERPKKKGTGAIAERFGVLVLFQLSTRFGYALCKIKVRLLDESCLLLWCRFFCLHFLCSL